MNVDYKAAYRYANSFFLVAKKKGKVQEFRGELAAMLGFTRQHIELERLLVTTTISYDEKDALIENLLSFASPESRNFVKLLVKKRRFDLFERITEEYTLLYNESEGIEEATVVTAFPLDKELENKLKSTLEKKWSKHVSLTLRTDPSLIGGMVIYTRDRVIDGSLKEKLRTLKKSILRS